MTSAVHTDQSGRVKETVTYPCSRPQPSPRSYRLMGKVMSLVPALRNMAQFHRYASCAGRNLYDAQRDPRGPSIHPSRRR
jgi:hypothetical protein